MGRHRRGSARHRRRNVTAGLSAGARVAVMSAVLVGAVGGAAGSQGALAATEPAPDCLGSTCTGRSPIDAGCAADAVSVYQDGRLNLRDREWPTFIRLHAPGLRNPDLGVFVEVQLRYSPRCRASWARVRAFSDDRPHGELSVWNPGEASQSTWIDADQLGTYFTPMVDGTKETCFGMQVHVADIWRAWTFGFCASPAAALERQDTAAQPVPVPADPSSADARPVHIQDVMLGGTWARVDPDDGSWHSRSHGPSNGRYWFPNGLGVAIDCTRAAAPYSVWFTDGHRETWSYWAHVTDDTWVPVATIVENASDGDLGLRHC